MKKEVEITEIIEFLRQNLQINVKEETVIDYGKTSGYVTIELVLKGEIISASGFSL